MAEPNKYPIFYDQKQRRWRYFKRFVTLLGVALSFIVVVVIISIVMNPVLPNLKLGIQSQLPQMSHILSKKPQPWNMNHKEQVFQLTKKRLIRSISAYKNRVDLRKPGEINNQKFVGFFVNWDEASWVSLKENYSKLDILIPEWYHLNNETGGIASDNSQKQLQVLDFLKKHRSKLAVMPLVNNFKKQQWDAATLSQVLKNSASRSRSIHNLLHIVREQRFAGICIDYENIPSDVMQYYQLFIGELHQAFEPYGLEVAVTIPVQSQNADSRMLAKNCDFVIVMAYDQHWATGTPGPVAAQDWYRNVLKKTLNNIPSRKLIMGIANYGYDWMDGASNGNVVTYQKAIEIARNTGSKVTFDPDSLNPTFDYRDQLNRLHQVWYLDAVTGFNQIQIAEAKKLYGFALWRMGAEDPDIWNIFHHREKLNGINAQTLQRLRFGYDIDYDGNGEILKVSSTPREGFRKIEYQIPTGLIRDEKMQQFPSPFTIERWGRTPAKKIALTFDDGPDPQFTPAILRVLRHYHVPATFFVIGLNADLNSDIIQKIVREGHEIGNHTFTHPNIATVPQEQLELEINATERLFESRLGRQSVLFRPPYAEDVEPETPEQVKPIAFASKLGYYTVGLQIDPSDWSRPGVHNIITRTLRQTESHLGNVVLLHDGGGDRSQTVAALPKIIEGLRARGYQFVTISDLLGLKRDQVMPPISQNELAVATIDEAWFLIASWVTRILNYLFILGSILGIAKLLFICVLAIIESVRRHRTRKQPDSFAPMVSVVIPAFNEEKVINKTIRSLLTNNYPNFEIIVVDDGSNDQTYEKVKAYFGNNPKVRAFRKQNEGKAEALNYGIRQSNAEIIVALDGDTVFLKDTIAKLAGHFHNQRVGAVAGNAKVGNRMNLFTKWQALEYVTSQNLDRRAFDLLNCITVVPGAVGAWRRSLILEAGGFAQDTLAEDADLTLTILQMGYEILYEPLAVALTEAPDTVSGFLKQRFRWMFGTMQVAWKHRKSIGTGKSKTVNLIALPNLFMFQILFPLISPLMDLFMGSSILWMLWQRYYHPGIGSMSSLKQTAFFYALFLLLDLLASLIAFRLEQKEDWRLIIWLVWQRFVYRQLMYFIALKSALTVIRGRAVGWGKLERKATVTNSQNNAAA